MTLLGILPKNALWSPLSWAIIWSLSGFKEQKLPPPKNKGKRLWDFSPASTYRKSLSCSCFGILCQCIQVRICYHNFFASKPGSMATTNSVAGTTCWMGGCSMGTSWTWAGIMPVCTVRSFLKKQDLITRHNHNYNKILKSDWLSTVLISAL